MNIADARPLLRVAYVPLHAHGDILHPDVECGTVSSFNHTNIFVRFDRQVRELGWEETTARACDPENLIMIGRFPG